MAKFYTENLGGVWFVEATTLRERLQLLYLRARGKVFKAQVRFDDGTERSVYAFKPKNAAMFMATLKASYKD